MDDLFYVVSHDIGWARDRLDKALSALSYGNDPKMRNIAQDYIMEASAKFLYGVERRINDRILETLTEIKRQEE